MWLILGKRVRTVNSSTWGKIFLVYFVVLALYSAFNIESMAATIAGGGFVGIALYFVSNPAYVILFFSLIFFNRSVSWWKNVIAAAAIIFASNNVSFPRLLKSGLPAEVGYRASLDSIVAQSLMAVGWSYDAFWVFYYIVLPLGLIVGAAWLVGWVRFGRMNGGGSK